VAATLGAMARTSARRPALARATLAAAALVALVVAVANPASTSAALAPFFPTQSLGDRGTDVAAIQQLFHGYQVGRGAASSGGGRVSTGARNPLVVPIDGIFSASTALGIKGVQAGRYLPESGIVDGATWQALIVQVGPGSTGDAVLALQRELRQKRRASVPLDGVYGAATTTAVTAFQAHMGLPQTGVANEATWRALVWHYEEPRFSSSSLCDYDPPANANWGTAEMIATLDTAGRAMVAAGYGRVAVGDVSYEHGGDHPEHVAHEVGLDADIRMMRKANDQCSIGANWRLAAYDRTATRALVKAIRAATPGHVKWIFFNDPVLIGEGLTTHLDGHDDHLHIHLCEASHPDRDYRC
jgi:peptidoglycan hydrolase-like protein with peptidoglycan-binding domain